MGTVFATSCGKFFDGYDLVKLIIVIGISEAEYAGTG